MSSCGKPSKQARDPTAKTTPTLASRSPSTQDKAQVGGKSRVSEGNLRQTSVCREGIPSTLYLYLHAGRTLKTAGRKMLEEGAARPAKVS